VINQIFFEKNPKFALSLVNRSDQLNNKEIKSPNFNPTLGLKKAVFQTLSRPIAVAGALLPRPLGCPPLAGTNGQEPIGGHRHL
jgi:hypothetical protein